MAHYDIVGNIAIIKFPREEKQKSKVAFAKKFLLDHKHISTVLEKSNKFSGRLRTQSTKFLAGVNTKEALYRENDCIFRLNIDTCYFSPRLSSERKDIASKVKRGESILVMFGGVAPFAIVIAKHSSAKKIVSVELGRDCSKYALENVRRNKLQEKVQIVQGDVRKKVPSLKAKFDRIVMSRPNLKGSFLDVAFKAAKSGTLIHYYGFYPESEISELKSLIQNESLKSKKKIKILRIKKAGEVGKRKFRFRVDFKVK